MTWVGETKSGNEEGVKHLTHGCGSERSCCGVELVVVWRGVDGDVTCRRCLRKQGKR